MFFRHIDDELKLSLSIPQYANELFKLTDRNRDFLKQWLPWLDTIKEPSDTKQFLEHQLLRFGRFPIGKASLTQALHVTIFYRNQIAGVVGFNLIDKDNNIGHLGYWLGEEYNGKGIMTKSVREVIKVGFDYYSLQRIDVRCAVGNSRSRAIPQRLNFQQEGIIRRAEKLCVPQESAAYRYVDHVIYGLLKS